MASKKVTVTVPLEGTTVKKGDNYIKGPDGRPIKVADKGAGRGRPSLHELSAVVSKSFEIIQTISAGERQKEAASRAGKSSGASRRGEANVVGNVPPRSDGGKTRDKVGKDFGVSGKYVDLGAKVLKTENPKFIKAVEDNLIAVSTAARHSSLSEAEQTRWSSA